MMASPLYLSHADNKFVGATLTVSSENVSYPRANAQSLPVAKPFRFTGVADENIQIDLGSALAINLAVVVNHNLTSGATITLTSGSAANPSGNAQTIPYRKYDSFIYFASAQTFRYWKIRFQDAANTDGYIQAGYVMLGSGSLLGYQSAYGMEFEDLRINALVRTEFGVPHIAALSYRIMLRMQFMNRSEAEILTLRTLFNALQRDVTPMFWVPDSAKTDGYLGRIASSFTRRLDFRHFVGIEFAEDGRGRSVAA